MVPISRRTAPLFLQARQQISSGGAASLNTWSTHISMASQRAKILHDSLSDSLCKSCCIFGETLLDLNRNHSQNLYKFFFLLPSSYTLFIANNP